MLFSYDSVLVSVVACRKGFEVQVDTSHEVQSLTSAGIRKNFGQV